MEKLAFFKYTYHKKYKTQIHPEKNNKIQKHNKKNVLHLMDLKALHVLHNIHVYKQI